MSQHAPKNKDSAKQKDFFVSYDRSDRKWAEWIARELEADGYTTVIQSWDFKVGSNFAAEMHSALKRCRRLVLVLSDDYLSSVFTQAEWMAVFVQDPTGSKQLMFPVRIAPCEPDGLLQGRVYCDLVGLGEEQARSKLLTDARLGPGTRAKRPGKAMFPGLRPSPASERRSNCEKVRELSEVLGTTRATFIAQAKLRNTLVAALRKRLKLREKLEYERFFERHFDAMNAEERRQHTIIRGYTERVLHEYNRRALRLAQTLSHLDDLLPSLPDLRDHLTLWNARYRSVFPLPSTCLVYVGVEEGKGFPQRVEDEIHHYLLAECGDARSRRMSGSWGSRESLD